MRYNTEIAAARLKTAVVLDILADGPYNERAQFWGIV